jgi:hypothetical protein
MIKLYRALYTPFPLAVLLSGLALGLSSNLMTDVFRMQPLDIARLVSAAFFFVSALLFSLLHAEFAKIDMNSRSLIYSGGGIPNGQDLIEDMLSRVRGLVCLAIILGVTSFLLGVAVSSGLLWFPKSALPPAIETAPVSMPAPALKPPGVIRK